MLPRLQCVFKDEEDLAFRRVGFYPARFFERDLTARAPPVAAHMVQDRMERARAARFLPLHRHRRMGHAHSARRPAFRRGGRGDFYRSGGRFAKLLRTRGQPPEYRLRPHPSPHPKRLEKDLLVGSRRALAIITNHQKNETPPSWTVEMSIPFAGLGPDFGPSPGKNWRVNFFRNRHVAQKFRMGDQRLVTHWQTTVPRPGKIRLSRFRPLSVLSTSSPTKKRMRWRTIHLQLQRRWRTCRCSKIFRRWNARAASEDGTPVFPPRDAERPRGKTMTSQSSRPNTQPVIFSLPAFAEIAAVYDAEQSPARYRVPLLIVNIRGREL